LGEPLGGFFGMDLGEVSSLVASSIAYRQVTVQGEQ
jgi:hypothetical protein